MLEVRRLTQCEYIKDSGERCRGRKIGGGPFCFAHEPSVADKRTEARSKGGKSTRRKALPPETSNVALRTVSDVEGLLSDTISTVRRGELDPKIANSVGYLAGMFLRAKEQGELADRLLAIERLLGMGGTRVDQSAA